MKPAKWMNESYRVVETAEFRDKRDLDALVELLNNVNILLFFYLFTISY